MLIPHPIASSARARPNHTALRIGDVSVTYKELERQISLRAGQLRAAGLEPDQTVILCKPRGLEWIVDMFAIGWCGAVAALVPCELTDDEWAARQNSLTIDWSLSKHQMHSETSIIPDLSADRLEEPHWSFDSPRFVLWTSGSTGTAKAVEITTGQWILSAFGSAIRLEHRLDDCWLSCLPFEHVGGLSILLRCALYGTTVDVLPRFDARVVAEALDGGQATHVSLVPAMLAKILDSRPSGPFHPRLRVILLGGAAASDSLVSRCVDASLPISLTWGMTETASQVCTSFPGSAQQGDQVGPPLAFNRVTMSDGCLAVALGTAETPLVTRDRGAVDPDGQVRVFGRMDDVIISGGRKFFPSEVENALSHHPSILEVALLARPCEKWGQRPVAFVVDPSGDIDSKTLMDWLDQRLSRYKVPKSWVFCDDLPRTTLGKVDRQRLRDWLSTFVEEPDGFQRRIKFIGALGGPHGRDVHEGVLQVNRGPEVIVGTDDVVAESDRSVTHPLDAELDRQPVSMSGHLSEGRFSMNQRKTNAVGVVAPLDASIGSGEHLLKADVSVLKDPIEKENTGPIDLVESGCNGNIERHNRALSPKDT